MSQKSTNQTKEKISEKDKKEKEELIKALVEFLKDYKNGQLEE